MESTIAEENKCRYDKIRYNINKIALQIDTKMSTRADIISIKLLWRAKREEEGVMRKMPIYKTCKHPLRAKLYTT